MRRVLPVLIAGALVWIACVGDDPGSDGNGDGGIPAGDRGGPCKSGVCLAGLTCLDNVCVLVDGGGTNDGGGTTDSGGGSDAADAASDGGADTGPANCNGGSSDSTKVACFSDSCSLMTGASPLCCISFNGSSASCVVANGCTAAGETPIPCDSPGECDGGTCCLNGLITDVPANACPTPNYPMKSTSCSVGAGCPGDKTKVCATNTDCVNGLTCKELIMKSGSGVVVIKLGLCL